MEARHLKDIAHFLGLKTDIEGVVDGASVDSRKVKKGDLFFALKGEKIDGHCFLKEVAAQGAVAAVVSKKHECEECGIPLLYVEDVLSALHKIAKELFVERSAQVAAVTGSVGKTTTKEFLSHLLKIKYKVGKTPGNSNSQIGLPLSILNSDDKYEIFVAEMGMSLEHEIERLVDIMPPDVALITKVGLSHAEFFEDGLQGIARAKAEILKHPKTRLALINAQAKQYTPMIETGSCKRSFFGLEGPHPDYFLTLSSGQFVIVEHGIPSPTFSLPFEASHLCENFVAAAAAAREFGLSWEEIIFQAQSLSPYKRRFEKIEREGVIYFNDAYNASPESMKAALMNLPKPKGSGRRIAVFGEMRELGHFSEVSHKDVASFALNYIDHLFCFGKATLTMVDVFSEDKRPVDFFTDLVDLRQHLSQFVSSGDVVLIKGSNSNGLWNVLEDE